MTDPDTAPTDQVSPPKPDPYERDVEAHRFGLHPLVTALVGLYFFLIIGGTVFVALWRDKMEMFDGLVVTVIFSAVIIGVPSWIAWRVTRSRLVGNIVCTLIVGLMVSFFFVGVFTTVSVANQNNNAMSEFDSGFEDQKAKSTDLMDRAIKGEDVTEESLEQFDQSMDRLDRLIDDSRGDQAKVFNILAEVMRRLEEPFSAYNESFGQLLQAGGVDPVTIDGPEAITERLGMVEDFALANERLTLVYASLEADLRTRLRAEKINDKMTEYIIGNWLQGARPDLVAKVRETDRDLVVSMRGILTTLAEAKDKWSMDGDQLIIEDDVLIEQYIKHYDNMIETSTLQEEYQRQIQEAIQNAEPTP